MNSSQSGTPIFPPLSLVFALAPGVEVMVAGVLEAIAGLLALAMDMLLLFVVAELPHPINMRAHKAQSVRKTVFSISCSSKFRQIELSETWLK